MQLNARVVNSLLKYMYSGTVDLNDLDSAERVDLVKVSWSGHSLSFSVVLSFCEVSPILSLFFILLSLSHFFIFSPFSLFLSLTYKYTLFHTVSLGRHFSIILLLSSLSLLWKYLCTWLGPVSGLNSPSYSMSRKYWPILYSKLLYKMDHYFLDTRYVVTYNIKLVTTLVTTSWTYSMCVEEVVTYFI